MPSADYVRCRHCYRLTYVKNQAHDKRFDFLAALQRGGLRAAKRFQPAYGRRMTAREARIAVLRKGSGQPPRKK